MRKIPTLFKRNDNTHLVTEEITKGCEWIFAHNNSFKVIPTVKYDGTACLMKDNILYKRYDAKGGKTPPLDFIPSQEPDPITGHYPGWIYCDPKDNSNKYHYEAYQEEYKKYKYNPFVIMMNGTFELIGEKIQGNPYKIEGHKFIMHGKEIISNNDLTITREGIYEYLKNNYVEGIVFYADCVNPFSTRICKIKRKDFGLPWNE